MKPSPSFHFAHNYTKIYHTCHEWRFKAEEQHTKPLYIESAKKERTEERDRRIEWWKMRWEKKMNKHTVKWLHIVCWHVRMQIMATLLTTSTELLSESKWAKEKEKMKRNTQPLINNMFARCLSLVHKIIFEIKVFAKEWDNLLEVTRWSWWLLLYSRCCFFRRRYFHKECRNVISLEKGVNADEFTNTHIDYNQIEQK